MDINSLLQNSGAISALSSQLGIDRATAERGAAALMPQVASGFQNPRGDTPQAAAAHPAGALGGLGGLGGLIGMLGGGGLLDNVVGNEPTQVGKGNDILGSIFGSKQASRDVAQEAAAQSGVEPSLLKKMLPILAMVVAGYMAKQATGGNSQDGGGLVGSILGGLMGGR